MKTRHEFKSGDHVKHGERYGQVTDRIGNSVVVRWDDGEVQTGNHRLLWMVEHDEAHNSPQTHNRS